MLKLLTVFHNQAARRIAGMTDQCTEVREWEYPPVADALEYAGIWPIKEYIQILQAIIA